MFIYTYICEYAFTKNKIKIKIVPKNEPLFKINLIKIIHLFTNINNRSSISVPQAFSF